MRNRYLGQTQKDDGNNQKAYEELKAVKKQKHSEEQFLTTKKSDKKDDKDKKATKAERKAKRKAKSFLRRTAKEGAALEVLLGDALEEEDKEVERRRKKRKREEVVVRRGPPPRFCKEAAARARSDFCRFNHPAHKQ